MNPRVGIVGGGILGLTAALRLAQNGAEVALYERSHDLGGLVGSFDFDGRRADRFYHVILPTDDRVIGLASELGLGDRFRFSPVGVGFYDEGRLFSMNSLREFLTFPLLPFHDRLRLGLFVARCQRMSSYADLDQQPLLEWLARMCGRRVTDRLWRPLLDSKFDGRFDDLPATYIWARTKRMSATRDSAGRELMGWLEGGYQTLIDALVAALHGLGVEIHAGVAVDEIAGDGSGVKGLVVDGRFESFDHVLCTLVPPQVRHVAARALQLALPGDHCRYLGVVCLLMRVDQSVSPYYTLNITDRRIPLTTVVETTHVVDPVAAGGSLLYITKYVDPSHDDLLRPADEVERAYRAYAETIFPDLRNVSVDACCVQRASIVEPVHLLGGAARIPSMFPVPGLALASTANVYPETVNGQAVLGVVDRVVDGLLERLPARRREAA